jgi:hypothetical protein
MSDVKLIDNDTWGYSGKPRKNEGWIGWATSQKKVEEKRIEETTSPSHPSQHPTTHPVTTQHPSTTITQHPPQTQPIQGVTTPQPRSRPQKTQVNAQQTAIDGPKKLTIPANFPGKVTVTPQQQPDKQTLEKQIIAKGIASEIDPTQIKDPTQRKMVEQQRSKNPLQRKLDIAKAQGVSEHGLNTQPNYRPAVNDPDVKKNSRDTTSNLSKWFPN